MKFFAAVFSTFLAFAVSVDGHDIEMHGPDGQSKSAKMGKKGSVVSVDGPGIGDSKSAKMGKKMSSKSSKPSSQTDIQVKDLSWLVGTWYPCKTQIAGLLVNQFPILVELDAPWATQGMLLEIESMAPVPPNDIVTSPRLIADFTDYLLCSLLDIDNEAECPVWNNVTNSGVALTVFPFVGSSSYSKNTQEDFTFVGRNGSYKDKAGIMVPIKSTVSIDQKFFCDVSQEPNGRLFCDIELNNVQTNGFFGVFGYTQYLVNDRSLCQYNPVDEEN